MKALRYIGGKFSKKLNTLVFFVTTSCNSRCMSCFYWKQINSKKNELTLNEIEEIAAKTGRFDNLLISGGEPFLREDLPEIIEIFYKKNKIKSVNIPTNATLTDIILKKTEEILKKCEKISLSLNLSLDGLEKTHDHVRGVRGTFKKLIKTEKALRSSKKRYANLDINITTVISNKNLEEIPKLIDFVKQNMQIDAHSLEIMRGNPRNKNMEIPSSIEVKKLLDYLEKTNPKKIKGVKERIKRNRIKALNKIQLNYLKGKKWPFRCLAGKSVAVLEPNGDVRLCELLPPVGNVRKSRYDLKKVLNSENAKKLKEKIKETNCSCTHCVFILESLEHTPTQFVKEVLLK